MEWAWASAARMCHAPGGLRSALLRLHGNCAYRALRSCPVWWPGDLGGRLCCLASYGGRRDDEPRRRDGGTLACISWLVWGYEFGEAA